jgi:L-threonylcarbamoyladenylate synthase
VKILTVHDDDIHIAADALKAGLLVAFPTETVYGLGGDGFNVSALAKIFAAKQRPRFDPLIIHIAEMSALDRAADIGKLTPSLRKKLDTLCQNLLPGPLTVVLPKQNAIPGLATSGLPAVAVRFPSHPVAQKLILYSTGAVAAPSANLFGYLSPTKAEHVREQLGEQVDFIIDGGRAGIGVESTVLDISEEPVRILRPGGTPREAIEALIGHVEIGGSLDSAPHAPGQLKSHYAPKTPLFLHNTGEMLSLPFRRDEAYLFFDGETRDIWKQHSGNETGSIFTLSNKKDFPEAAANLFDTLHVIDKIKVSAIHAQSAPDSGLGLAINDRLARAAAKR